MLPATAEFFASIFNPEQVLSSKQVSITDVIEGGYNTVHICSVHLDGQPPFPFVLRVPLRDSDTLPYLPRWSTSTAVGCMRYCQRHFSELRIPTPEIYAFNESPGAEFIAMEYVDGETLSHIWMDLSEDEKESLALQICDIYKSMRSRRFDVIGGITPDGSPSPIVHGVDASNGRALLDFVGLYNIGPYYTLTEWVLSLFDREIHYFDQILHHQTLKEYEAKFKSEMEERLSLLTPETVLERLRSHRDALVNAKEPPFNPKPPFVLHHGDFHGRNVLVSREAPFRILSLIDWDFGGSHPLPRADKDFEVISDPEDAAEADEQSRWQDRIEELLGGFTMDIPLNIIVSGTYLLVLEQREAKRRKHDDEGDDHEDDHDDEECDHDDEEVDHDNEEGDHDDEEDEDTEDKVNADDEMRIRKTTEVEMKTVENTKEKKEKIKTGTMNEI